MWLRRAACMRQGRMKRLEGVRLEVDSRRHTVAALGAKIEAQRARLPQTRSKGEFQMEQTIRKMQHKENKLAGARPAPCRKRDPAQPSLHKRPPFFVPLKPQQGLPRNGTALLSALCSRHLLRLVDMRCLL